MARNPHLKVSFEPINIEHLEIRAEQSGMKRPQDYIRELVKADALGKHVVFDERNKLQEKVNYLEKDNAEKEGALENHRKFADEIRDICDVPKTDSITFDDLAEKARTLREECGVRGVSERHWKKEFEHQKKECNQLEKSLDNFVKGMEESEKVYIKFIRRIRSIGGLSPVENHTFDDIADHIKNTIDNFKIACKSYREDFQRAGDELNSMQKERDDWAAKANEAAAEAVELAGIFVKCKPIIGTSDKDIILKWIKNASNTLSQINHILGPIESAGLSDMVEKAKSVMQDLETTKADLKNTNAAAIANTKEIASSLGVPDTVEHVVQRIGELNDSLKYCVNYGNAMANICDVIGINSFEDDNLSVIVDKVGELGQNLETAKSDREKVINELKTLGDKWEVKYVEQKKLANDPIVKIIWRRFRQSFSDLFRHKGNE